MEKKRTEKISGVGQESYCKHEIEGWGTVLMNGKLYAEKGGVLNECRILCVVCGRETSVVDER